MDHVRNDYSRGREKKKIFKTHQHCLERSKKEAAGAGQDLTPSRQLLGDISLGCCTVPRKGTGQDTEEDHVPG